MPDHHPRYVVREQYGTTVGERRHTYDFLILDSWYGYREVLWVKRRRAGSGVVATLRRRVYEYAALLNTPRSCACGCGRDCPVLEFARGANTQPRYASSSCKYRAKHQRARGRVS